MTPKTKLVIMKCTHSKTIARNLPVYVGSLIRCPECKDLQRIINVLA